MSSYIGRHAELYDLFYSDKEYEKESAFVHQCISTYGVRTPKKILELACGTGSHAFELEKLGYDIVATDYSEDMLKNAQKKADGRSSKIIFRKQDMRNLDIEEKPFDVVICLFDSIGYVISNDALNSVIEGVHQSLIKNGLFIFEFWHSPTMIKKYDPLRVKRWILPESEIIRISETTLDILQQTADVKYTILELKKNGRYEKIDETQQNRFFSVPEMKSLLMSQKFEPLAFFSGFTDNTIIDEESWHIVAVARRK